MEGGMKFKTVGNVLDVNYYVIPSCRFQ